MKSRIFRKIFGTISPIFLGCIFLCSCSSNYVVTWSIEGNNFDEKYEKNEIPAFKGKTPIKISDNKNYIFDCWEPEIKPVTSNITYSAKFIEVSDYFVVDFDTCAGSEIDSQLVIRNGKISKPSDPVKYGYNFIGWKSNEKLIYDTTTGINLFDSFFVTENLTLTAIYKPDTFEIKFSNLNDATGKMENCSLQFDSSFVLPKNQFTLSGYSFKDWSIDEFTFNDNQLLSILDVNRLYKLSLQTNKCVNLISNWITNSYIVGIENDFSKGIVTGFGSYKFGELVTLTAIANTGYEFNGWYLNGNLVSSENEYKFYMSSSKLNYTTKWNTTEYSIFYELDGGINNKTNPAGYNIESSDIKLLDPEREGYIFTGWSDNGYIRSGSSGDKYFTANWKLNSYEIKAFCDSSRGKITGLGNYNFCSTAKLSAKPFEGYSFFGWFIDFECYQMICKDEIFNYVVESKDITFFAKFITNEEKNEWNINNGIVPTISEDGDFIYYGMYPQNVDDSYKTRLDKMPFNCANEFGYYFYKDAYYFKIDNVKFYYESKNGYFLHGYTVKENESHWYRVMPIKWRVLESNNNSFLLFSDSILFSAQFNDDLINTIRTDYQGKSGIALPSVYKFSNLRKFLNCDFYKQAFFLNNDHILISEITNNESTNVSLNSESVFDKIFILSKSELLNYESITQKTRNINISDFAICSNTYNLNNNFLFTTRTPINEYEINYRSQGLNSFYNGSVCEKNGIVPSLRLSF